MNSSPSPEDLVQQVTAAVAGLNWMSETDAPFEVLCWTGIAPERLTPAQILTLAQLPPETPIAGLDLATFLEPVTHGQAWNAAEENQIAVQFQALQRLLEQTLTQIVVYRCGTTELDIFIVGYSQDSHWLVLHTTAVET